MTGLLRALQATLIATLISVSVVYAYFAFFEPPPIRYPTLPIPVLGDVRVGEPIRFTFEVCVDRPQAVDVAVFRMLMRSDLAGDPIHLAPGQVTLPPGCQTINSAANKVPIGTAPGAYFLQGWAQPTGASRSARIYWTTTIFRVLPPQEAKP